MSNYNNFWTYPMSELLNPQFLLIQKWSTMSPKYNPYTHPHKVKKEGVK